MRLAQEHIRFIAEKIARELANSSIVTLTKGLEKVADVALNHLQEEVKLEKSVDTEVNDIMDDQDDEISFYQADRKQLFWMIKKKVASEQGLILDRDDRFSSLSHRILDELYEEDLISYTVSENRVKNLITKAIFDYGKRQDELEDTVHQKLKTYKRTIHKGTEEYEILFEKLYEEEARKLGLS